jgi:hypothetical protein
MWMKWSSLFTYYVEHFWKRACIYWVNLAFTKCKYERYINKRGLYSYWMLIMRLAQKYAYRSEVLVVSSQSLRQNYNNHARTANLCGMLCFCNIAFGKKPKGLYYIHDEIKSVTNAENVFCLSFCNVFYMVVNCGVDFKTNKMGANTVEPGYNDIGLYDIWHIFFHWHYSPLWALACRTRSFHFFLSVTNSLHHR